MSSPKTGQNQISTSSCNFQTPSGTFCCHGTLKKRKYRIFNQMCQNPMKKKKRRSLSSFLFLEVILSFPFLLLQSSPKDLKLKLFQWVFFYTMSAIILTNQTVECLHIPGGDIKLLAVASARYPV